MNQSLTDPVARWSGDEKSSAPSTVSSLLKKQKPHRYTSKRRLKLGLHHSDDFGLQGFSFPSNNQSPLFFFFF